MEIEKLLQWMPDATLCRSITIRMFGFGKYLNNIIEIFSDVWRKFRCQYETQREKKIKQNHNCFKSYYCVFLQDFLLHVSIHSKLLTFKKQKPSHYRVKTAQSIAGKKRFSFHLNLTWTGWGEAQKQKTLKQNETEF